MSVSPMTFARRSPGLLTRVVPDRRRHRRISVELLGRFMRENKEEHACQLLNISAGGAAIRLMAPATMIIGERVVAFFEHIGGIEGTVAREFDGGFAIKLRATQHKREKLAATLTWLANRSELSGIDERRHERIAPSSGRQRVLLPDGGVIECRVLDISVSGASVGTPARPPIGTEVTLGKLRARVVRHHAHGFGVQFIEDQSQAALRRHFG
jgi:c-di-GMP-binding flagellar brake protein YcgR